MKIKLAIANKPKNHKSATGRSRVTAEIKHRP